MTTSPRSPSSALLAFILAMPVLACSETTFDVAGGDVDVQLTVTPATQTLGQAVTWETAAVGRSLSGTIVRFGDGTVDSVAALGAQTQGLIDMKTYDSVGVYTIIARAEDQFQGAAEDTATVEIVPAG